MNARSCTQTTARCNALLYLPVDRTHTLAVRHLPSAEAASLPVIVLHGGPGGGASVKQVQFLRERRLPLDIVMFDQRGCGRSTPRNCLLRNTTPHLVRDVERVRRFVRTHTDDPKWDRPCVFGASFGAVLAVLYAAQYPHRVRAAVVHGFTALSPFFSRALKRRHPAVWREWRAAIPPPTRSSSTKNAFFADYLAALRSSPRTRRCQTATKAWAALESPTTLYHTRKAAQTAASKRPRRSKAVDRHTIAMLECHYAAHDSFLPAGGVPILDVARRIGAVPVHITHGAHDVICPIHDARTLAAALENATFIPIERSGHALLEAGTRRAWCRIVGRLVSQYQHRPLLQS